MPANSSAPKYLKMRFIIVLSKIAYKGTTKKRYMQTQSVKKIILRQFLHIFSIGIRRKVLQKSYKSLIWVLPNFGKHAARLMWKN